MPLIVLNRAKIETAEPKDLIFFYLRSLAEPNNRES